MPVPPEQSKKQQREQQRAEKVAEFKRQQAKAKRNRRIGFIGGGVGAAVVIALIVTFVVVTSVPKPDPASIQIDGLKTFGKLEQTHTTNTVDYKALYGMDPPAGGQHNPVWLNCGIYTEPQVNENAVHVLEHGAVWVTYDPTKITGDALAKLQGEVPKTYIVLSPYPGLPAPVVASAWSAQVQLTGVDDPRLQQFINKYWKAATAPEAGASCSGAIDGPGKIS